MNSTAGTDADDSAGTRPGDAGLLTQAAASPAVDHPFVPGDHGHDLYCHLCGRGQWHHPGSEPF